MAAKKACNNCGLKRKEIQNNNRTVCNNCQKKVRQANARRKHLLDTYGITQEEYDRLLEEQGGACYICNGTRNYNLQVDHCHKTGRIRGLLCKTCNKRLLPAARDSVARLSTAIDYLNFPPAFEVLGERVVPNHT